MQLNRQEQINKKRLRVDTAARGAFTVFGLMVLAMFLLIIFHILSNSLPLFKKPSLSLRLQSYYDVDLPMDSVKQMGDSVLTLSYENCKLFIQDIIQIAEKTDGAQSNVTEFTHSCQSQFVNVDDHKYSYQAKYAMLRPDGLLEIFSIERSESNLSRRLLGSFNIAALNIANSIASGTSEILTSETPTLEALSSQAITSQAITSQTSTSQTSTSKPSEYNFAQQELAWQIEMFESNIVLHASLNTQQKLVIWHELSALALPKATLVDTQAQSTLLVLPRYSQMLHANESELELISKDGRVLQSLSVSPSSHVHIMRMPDESALFIVNSESDVEVWRRVNVSGEFLFSKSGVITQDTPNAIKDMVFSRQSLIASAVDNDNNIMLINSASNQVVNTQKLQSALGISNGQEVQEQAHQVNFLHWYNQQLYVFYHTHFEIYSIENPAGITTFKSLFSKLQYSGYDSEQYIWQTSQSAEYAQTKFSIIPLIVGSLKASILALFVAIPLAIGGAMYTAYFASAKIRNWLKPSIEMIEAVPSVIIGFIAAIWLAPFAERSLFALLGTIVSLPLLVLGMAALHGLFKQVSSEMNSPSKAYLKFEKYYVLFVALFFLSLLTAVFYLLSYIQIWLAQDLGSDLGNSLGNGLANGLGNGLENGFSFAEVAISKTTVVVALALGIAVSPTIYSLVDDALFEVPEGIKQASAALGATEIQTLYRVVLLVALPSIISAIMLGLGRAFGETMILLMVTGNTPIADWGLLSGLRALTSNLTIELQESNVGSEHYHILFFTALILFTFTFAINTVAALLKRRLQRGNQHA